ncbi:hypothetical protein [Nocardia bovistercoris]|uniref:Uncharacterized protein n=1 Tax=Nocardia bovistercoris TaxID=2785916 RepID=A0A931N4K5_9NOCA|nr:hypothetical protein [Nocardia bovistercoris]MBH0778356.1 hypothetical protein [Nocardia bovistercoris]
MTAELAGVSAWPQQWRWDDDLVDGYRARGMSGVAVEEIDVDGVRESGVLLPMRQPPRWQAVVFGLMGFVFLALAVLLFVEVVLNHDWLNLLGVVLFVGIGAVTTVASYRGLLAHRRVVPGLLLTPTRVIRRGGGGDLLVVAWSEIAEIRAYTRDMSKRKWHNMFGIDVRDPDGFRRAARREGGGRLAHTPTGPEVVMVSDAVMRMNPLLAYHLVRHYFRHPEQRHRITRAVGAGG